MSSRIDVVLVTNAASGGGAERAAEALAAGLESLGNSVALVPLRAGGQFRDPGRPDMFNLGKQPGSGWRGQLLAFRRFRSLLERLDPVVLHAHCEAPETLLLASGNRRARRFATEHQVDSWDNHPTIGQLVRVGLKRTGTRWIVPRAGMIVKGHGPPDFVIPNATEVSTETLRATQDRPRVVVVSQLISLKRVDWVIRAAAAQVDPPPVVLIGDGPLKRELLQLGESLGVRVEAIGFQRDPWSHVASHDVVVSASGSESDGLAVLEAVCMGLRVLASNIEAHKTSVPQPSRRFSSIEELASQMSTFIRLAGTPLGKAEERHSTRLRHERSAAFIAELHREAYGLDRAGKTGPA